MKDICVVIPMYGKGEYTKSCIDKTIENAGIKDFDILVVDDGSPEPFHHEGAIHLRLPENKGFTNAANQGILWCGDMYKYIHLLNNDTEPFPNFLKILYEYMEANSGVGIACSARVLKTDKAHNVELFGADLIRGYQIMTDESVPPDAIPTYWVPLCSAMLRHEMIREIGILDKSMKIWSSDLEYCIRSNIKGWNVVVKPDSRVFHIHQVTTGTNNSEGVQKDQMALLEILSGIKYAEIMTKMPLDCESNTYGSLEFKVFKK